MSTKRAPSHAISDIVDVPLKDIEISNDNVRHSDPMRDLDELAASIRIHGLLQPVVLRGVEGKPPYDLIGGQRRFLAHQKVLKTKTIRAVFVGNMSKTESVIRSLVENLQRVELEYGDTAEAVTFLYKQLGNDERKVQEQTGLSIRKIRDFIEIDARATPHMKALLKAKRVSIADVKRSIRAAQDNLQKAEELLDLIVKYQPTSHQKRRLVSFGEQNKSASAAKILKEATKPSVEQNLIITLPDELIAALRKATKSLSIEADELAAQVLTEWLRNQGFTI
jgi:ParB/RepB/Spo0J family partition protein